MLDTRKEATDALARAVSDALTNGLTTDDIDEIAQMVAAQQPLDLDYSAQHAAELSNGADDLPIYTELPEGLIDLASAAAKFGRSRQLLWQWVHQGRIEERGLLKQSGSTVANVLVLEDDVAACIKGKLPPVANNNGTQGNLVIGADRLPVYTDLPDGLIDLPSAMRRYGCKAATLRGWVYQGHLKAVGRLRGSSPGGGYLVVSEAELEQHLASPRKKGRKPKIKYSG